MDLVPHIRKRLEELLRGKYSDINLLNSSGGMGVIFKAMDTDLNVPRVIKVFPPGLALTEAARKRFLDEAQLQAGLSHANIVPVVNLLRDPQDPDFLAFIMPFISGESLADRLERSPTKPLGLEQTVSIMRQVLLALDHAHRQKIIHRDI
jgi:serine/threonine protein kinase